MSYQGRQAPPPNQSSQTRSTSDYTSLKGPRQTPNPRYDQNAQSTPHRSQGAPQQYDPPKWPLREDADDTQYTRINTQSPRSHRPSQPNQPLPLTIPKKLTGNKGSPVPQSTPQHDQDPGSRLFGQQDVITSWVKTVSPMDSSSGAIKPFRDPSPSTQIEPQIPQPLYQPYRRPPLGPPPSARRGPSFYYSQSNYVSPIVEETDSQRRLHDSRGSFASSNAIPIGIPNHYLDHYRASVNEDHSPLDDDYQDDVIGDEEHSRVIPVRQASIGRRSVPTLTTIKNNESRPDSQTRPLGCPSVASSIYNETDVGDESFPLANASSEDYSLKSRPQMSARTNGSKMTSNWIAPKHEYEKQRPLREISTSQVSNESHSGNIEQSGGASPGNPKSLSQRIGTRRPPRLNIDTVREAEARGSLTSLPDLIRRATKVAANLDRGKTASRFGMSWLEDDQNRPRVREQRRSGSLSDILASFPPPGLATPPGSRGSPMIQWPSNLKHSTLPSESDPGEFKGQRKRCCGMPLWLFLLLLTLGVLLVAAAIIVPIVLIVIPNQARTSGTASALASCQKSLTCENGGTNIVGSDGSCSCLCVNGYAGSQCATASSASCTTVDIGGTSNVTLGDSIPRLLSRAETNFGIPLIASNILGLFSSSNLTCTSENALVTFNGLSARFDSPRARYAATKTLNRRASASSAGGTAATSNGIVFQSGSPTETSSSSSATATASSNSTTLDFARVAVLFVLQEVGHLSGAVTAQENLQDYFTSGTTDSGESLNASSIDLGSGFSADLQQYSVQLANGTVVGG